MSHLYIYFLKIVVLSLASGFKSERGKPSDEVTSCSCTDLHNEMWV